MSPHDFLWQPCERAGHVVFEGWSGYKGSAPYRTLSGSAWVDKTGDWVGMPRDLLRQNGDFLSRAVATHEVVHLILVRLFKNQVSPYCPRKEHFLCDTVAVFLACSQG